MHSSRMRTARSLTVSRRVLCMPPQQPHMPPATTHAPYNHTPNHAYPYNHTCPPQPCMSPHNHTHPPQPCMPPTTTHAPTTMLDPPATMHAPPVNRITDTCKNITFPQLRLRAVISPVIYLSTPIQFPS